jgi:hypothetical protein
VRAKRNRVQIGLAVACALALSVDAALAASTTGAGDLRLAYVDPGSGSFILQALVATAAGAAVAINAYWRKIMRLLGRGGSEAEEEAADSQSQDD